METGKTDYLNNLLDNGFRGVRYLCGSARDLRSIAEALTIHGLPLFYPLIPFGFDLLEDILENYRELNVIVLSASWSDNRRLFPLLERHDRLYFEYSRNQANDILEITKKHFGIERVLFGTGWPYTSMGALNPYGICGFIGRRERCGSSQKCLPVAEYRPGSAKTI